MEGSFVDAALKDFFSDRLFELTLKSGDSLFVYCLVEHKSSPEPRVALQVLRYLVEVWEQLARRTKGQLPQVVPMLVYHGERPWALAPSFQALVEQRTPQLGVRPLDFELVVVDVGALEDDALSADPTLRAGLLGLKYATHEAMQQERLGAFLEALTLAPSLIAQALRYILVAYRRVNRTLLLEEVRRVMPEYEEEMLSLAAREWMAEGRVAGWQEGRVTGWQEGRVTGWQEGSAEGRVQGRVQGRVEALLRVLEHRFGPLPADRAAQVTGSNADELDTWLDRALEATSLDGVFDPPH